eukprot:1606786-Prymnesium_polylepis.1
MHDPHHGQNVQCVETAPFRPAGLRTTWLRASRTPTESHCPVLKHAGQYSTPPQSLYSHLAATRQLTGEAECTSRTKRSARPVPLALGRPAHEMGARLKHRVQIAWPMAQTFWPMLPTPKRPLFTLVCILATK